MPTFKSVFTSQDLADRYRVNPDTIRTLIDRLGLRTRLAHWRVVPASELGRLEDALLALGYKLPDPIQPQPAAEEGSWTS